MQVVPTWKIRQSESSMPSRGAPAGSAELRRGGSLASELRGQSCRPKILSRRPPHARRGRLTHVAQETLADDRPADLLIAVPSSLLLFSSLFSLSSLLSLSLLPLLTVATPQAPASSLSRDINMKAVFAGALGAAALSAAVTASPFPDPFDRNYADLHTIPHVEKRQGQGPVAPAAPADLPDANGLACELAQPSVSSYVCVCKRS